MYLIFIILASVFIPQSISSSTECTSRFMDLSLLQYRATQIPNARRSGSALNDNTRILKDIEFNCTTLITGVVLGAELRMNRDLFPSVSIWGKVETSDTGNNDALYERIPESTRFIYFSTDNVSTSGTFEYYFDTPISVKAGDVFSISQASQADSQLRVYYIDHVDGFISHEVMLSSTTADLSMIPVIDDELVLAYPIAANTRCINSKTTLDLIKTRSLEINSVRSRSSRSERQYLYPQMNFSCSGSITKWIYGGLEESPSGISPELQIWYQVGIENYIKRGFTLATSNTQSMGTNVYSLESQLDFHEGDFLGIYYPKESETQIELYDQERSGPMNLRMSGMIDEPPSTINEELRTEGSNSFPLVSVEIKLKPVSLINMPVQLSTSVNLISATRSDMTPLPSTVNMILSTSSANVLPSIPLQSNTSQFPEIYIYISISIATTIGMAITVSILITVCCIVIIRRKKRRQTTGDVKVTNEDLQFNPLYLDQYDKLKYKTEIFQLPVELHNQNSEQQHLYDEINNHRNNPTNQTSMISSDSGNSVNLTSTTLYLNVQLA